MDKKSSNLRPVILVITRRQYSDELKHHVCREHIEEGIGLSELVRKYQLSSHSLIHQWLRKYGYIEPTYKTIKKPVYLVGLDNYMQMPVEEPKNPQEVEINKKEDPANPSEIVRLKRELLEAKIKAEGFERMIEIAEEEFKIQIRKK